MIKLYIFRASQASTLEEAMSDGAVYYVGKFETQHAVDVAKGIVEVTADCIDAGEDMVYVEVGL